MKLKQALGIVYRKLFLWQNAPSTDREPLMYRSFLYQELISLAGRQSFLGKRILEIGPKDGLDSKRLASLEPSELLMIDLPEKRDQVAKWLAEIQCAHRYIEANLMYIPYEEYLSLGKFDLIWCTGVLYHNAEQLRLLRKLYKLLKSDGYFVLESATLRLAKALQDGCYIEIHYPQTYRNTGTVTHLPTANAIKAWLQMVGFQEIHTSSCFEKENRDLIGQRYACICRKTGDDESDIYYGKSGLNPQYKFGDSV
jgi:2-polyprenyl-3-methyl-5-hydroxy-6-metoxy-1,4-benzoquinol methylase